MLTMKEGEAMERKGSEEEVNESMKGKGPTQTETASAPSPLTEGTEGGEVGEGTTSVPQKPGAVESLPMCQECEKAQSKYRCPACGRLTCSLVCCQAHKKRQNCNGKRSRTDFVRVSQFTDQQLHSDYFFLEDALRTVEGSKREFGRLGTSIGTIVQEKDGRQPAAKRRRGGGRGGARGRREAAVVAAAAAPAVPLVPEEEEEEEEDGNDDDEGEAEEGEVQRSRKTKMNRDIIKPEPCGAWLSAHPDKVQQLVRHAHEQQRITLLLMPPGMTRRKINSTFLKFSDRTVHWRVEWVFGHALGGAWSVVDDKVSERAVLQDLLAGHLGASSSAASSSSSSNSSSNSNSNKRRSDARGGGALGNAPKRQRLKTYGSAPPHSLRLFLQIPFCRSDRQRWYELRPDASLLDNLRDKVVIEFPVIHVALRGLDDDNAFPSLISEATSAPSSSSAAAAAAAAAVALGDTAAAAAAPRVDGGAEAQAVVADGVAG